ncbi:hypothetical protein SAMN04487869_12831 [Marinobacter sp. DSM 26671]|uniref:hypothetical protein n=1 Tax=Marinobacter sp. DSM 26671 TaxID=1761793 RepID=UPI0008E2BC79|nr:hypothetical protein [Marinobacter sp. DSM 26671]SFE95629.1 hypothetical protein SAMN04487869_12831 [Marinobacter sp. DSM 26671]
MKNKLLKSFLISTLIISGCSSTGTSQGLQTNSTQTELETEELVSIENELQGLKNRISKLEARLSLIKGTGDPVTINDGWKRVESWRKLEAEMDYESVERILGPAHRIDGGIVANWYYENGGRVTFYRGSVQSWEEPD